MSTDHHESTHMNATNTLADALPVRLYQITVPRDRGLVLGHGWLSDRDGEDGDLPVRVCPDGVYTADQVPGLHWTMTWCPYCPAEQTYYYETAATVVVTWHADRCPWYESVTDGVGGEAA
jgi:hypothetical protein